MSFPLSELGLVPGRGMRRFDVGVGAGVDERFVVVVQPADHVRRLTMRITHRGDEPDPGGVVDVRALENEPVTNVCSHASRVPGGR